MVELRKVVYIAVIYLFAELQQFVHNGYLPVCTVPTVCA